MHTGDCYLHVVWHPEMYCACLPRQSHPFVVRHLQPAAASQAQAQQRRRQPTVVGRRAGRQVLVQQGPDEGGAVAVAQRQRNQQLLR